MTPEDWGDPFFIDDPAAQERERRRVEREARRRERQQALADRVRSEREPDVPEAPAAPTRPVPPQDRPTPPPAPERAAGRPRADLLWQRRAIGLALIVACGALVVFGVVTAADRLGGGDEPAPAPVVAKTFSVTIPEGYDRTQTAAVAEEAGVKGSYEDASEQAKGFDPAKYGAESPPSLEGFLFPATYELERGAEARALVARQLEAFEREIRGVDMGYAQSRNLNEYDILKIASMIEREVQVPEERELVAAVIYNRLSQQINLGIDATIRYEDQNYDEQLTNERLNQNTPYNTRLNPGLPPTPIGNPGLASIEAAANPAKEDYLYFVVKPGTCGEHFFTASEAEFNRASAEYQAALEAEGGSPTDC